MKKTLLLSAGILCAVFTLSPAQQHLQLDAGGGNYALIVAPSTLPVGTTIFTLPEANSILISNSNTESYNWVLGGNSSPLSSNLLGTLTNDDIDFVTGAGGPNLRMRILAGGAVQVGGTGGLEIGPDGDLDKIKGQAYSWPASNLTPGFLNNDGAGNLTWATSIFADRATLGTWFEGSVNNNSPWAAVGAAGGGTITQVGIPFAGSVTGLAVTLADDVTNGTASFEVVINGNPTGLIVAITNTGGVNDKFGFTSQAAGLDTFVAGGLVSVRFMTTNPYGPNTDAYITVYGQF